MDYLEKLEKIEKRKATAFKIGTWILFLLSLVAMGLVSMIEEDMIERTCGKYEGKEYTRCVRSFD